MLVDNWPTTDPVSHSRSLPERLIFHLTEGAGWVDDDDDDDDDDDERMYFNVPWVHSRLATSLTLLANILNKHWTRDLSVMILLLYPFDHVTIAKLQSKMHATHPWTNTTIKA